MSEKAPPKKKKTVPVDEKTLDDRVASDSVATPGHGEFRDDGALKEAVLAAALPDAAFDGFSAAVLAKAGKSTGVDADALARLFPEGPLSLIEYYSVSADGEMEKRL